MRSLNEIEKGALAMGIFYRSGPEWPLSLPLSRLLRYCNLINEFKGKANGK
ncbi:TPA: hypothetical protein IGZ61_002237 [Escherichia coli]|nr:hypothetical protein [Escherichia coli]